MQLTLPQYASVCGCCSGSPYTSLVEVRNMRARQRLARPSMLSVPRNDVLVVLMGSHLRWERMCLTSKGNEASDGGLPRGTCVLLGATKGTHACVYVPCIAAVSKIFFHLSCASMSGIQYRWMCRACIHSHFFLLTCSGWGMLGMPGGKSGPPR